MTFVQRNEILNPVEGLMVYCTNCKVSGTGVLSIYQNGTWQNVTWSCEVPFAPIAGTHIPEVTQITWNWNTVPIALGYMFYTGGSDPGTDVGNATSYTETGLTCWTSYTRWVRPYNACGQEGQRVLSQATLQIPLSPAPTEGTHDVSTLTTIVWNWSTMPGATGYKWNTINDFTSATNMGTSTSKTETGLACNTSYSRYVWAYNICGASTATTLTQTSSIYPPDSPTAGTHVPSRTKIIWNWNSVSINKSIT